MDFMDFMAVIFFFAIIGFIGLLLSPIIIPLVLLIKKVIKKIIENIVRKNIDSNRLEFDAVAKYLCEHFIELANWLASAKSNYNREEPIEKQIPYFDLEIFFGGFGVTCHIVCQHEIVRVSEVSDFNKNYYDICGSVINRLNKIEAKILRDKVVNKMQEKLSQVRSVDNNLICIGIL